jgi:hypothetical protein
VHAGTDGEYEKDRKRKTRSDPWGEQRRMRMNSLCYDFALLRKKKMEQEKKGGKDPMIISGSCSFSFLMPWVQCGVEEGVSYSLSFVGGGLNSSVMCMWCCR